MDFVESLAIRLPDIEAQLQATDLRESSGLVIEVAAIHEGVTANFNRYPALELASSLPTWTSPYPKPVILHHDPYTDALGRVIGSRMDKEDDDGSSYIRLQVAVTDTEAVQKVKDKRYLTGSVGGKAGKATCTICKADWSNASMFDLPCKHIRGREYDGKLAMIDMAEITWKEYSFVNMPADDRSGIRKLSDAGDGAGDKAKGRESVDFHSARFYCLDLKQEAISEFSESATHDVLRGLETNAASSLYHALKGAFLSAVATSKEDDVAVPITPAVTLAEGEEEEDVLAVSESLSDDLASAAEHDPNPGGDAADPDPDQEEPPAPDGDSAADDDDEQPDPVASDDAPTGDSGGGDAPDEPEPDAEQPAADADAGDDDSEDDSDDDDEDDEEEGEGVGDEPAAQDGEPEETPGENEPEGNESEASALQARVAELEARESALADENGRLRTALKRGLAERVVDMKITLGLHTPEEREQLLEEHMKRSAGSLADSLRDLASLPQQTAPWKDAPKVDPAGHAVGGENDRDSIVDDEEDPTPTEQQALNPEDFFVDVLMQRRSL